MDLKVLSRGVSLNSVVWGAERDLPLICYTGGMIGSFGVGVELLVCPEYRRVFGIEGISGRCVYDGERELYCSKFNVIPLD